MLLNILVFAAVNRVRGGLLNFLSLPGHSRFWASGLVGLYAVFSGMDTYASVAWAMAFLAWSWPAWSRWWHLDDQPLSKPDKPSITELLIEKLASFLPGKGFMDAKAFVIRHSGALFVGLLPVYFVTGAAPFLMVLPFGLAVLATYYWAFRHAPVQWEVGIAEVITGALWGLMIFPSA